MVRCLLILVAIAGCSVRDATFTGIGGGDDGDDAPGADAAIDSPPGTPDLVVSETMLTVGEGQMVAFTVALAGDAPAAPVTVTLTSTLATLAPSSLVFMPADYTTPQTVTVTPIADGDFNFATGTIQIGGDGLIAKQTALRVIETEIIEVTPLLGSVCPGDSAAAQIRLRGDPLGTLTVDTVVSGDATVFPTTFTFDSATFGTFQAVDMSGGIGPSTANIDFASAGLTAPRFRLTIRSPGSPICTLEPVRRPRPLIPSP